MSVAIPNCRKWFYQWDLNQVLEVKDHPVGTPVHFSLHERDTSDALVLETYAVDETIVVDVPNILLQNFGQLHVYVYPINDSEGHTEEHWKFEVRKREKPSNYVYTETEVLIVKKAVEDALLNAKEKGEFDGKDGKSAYQYAQDGGYKGTEEQFAKKMAEEVYSKAETDAAISEATKEDEYELIETVTFTGEEASIGRTKEPNGTPYNFKKVYVFISSPGGQAEKKAGTITVNGKNIIYMSELITTYSNGRLVRFFAEVENGMLKSSVIQANNSNYEQVTANTGMYQKQYGGVMVKSITSITVGVASADVPPVAGTYFEIWGVRA